MKKWIWAIIFFILALLIINFVFFFSNNNHWEDPYSGNAGEITARDLSCGSYFGDYNQKKIGTPEDWVHSLSGTKSAMWHAPKNYTSPMEC